jgi:hypothetical protein
MKYSGKLYGKAHGKNYFPLVLTAEDVDRIEMERDQMKESLEYILGIGLTVKTTERAERALGISGHNADVDLPDTSAQDSASKSNNPAVSG